MSSCDKQKLVQNRECLIVQLQGPAKVLFASMSMAGPLSQEEAKVEESVLGLLLLTISGLAVVLAHLHTSPRMNE